MSPNIVHNNNNNDNIRPTALGWVPKQGLPRTTTSGGIAVIARSMGQTWGPSGAGRTQVGPMLAPWTLLSGYVSTSCSIYGIYFQAITENLIKTRGLNYGVFLLKASFYKIIYCWSKERRLLISASDMQLIAWLSNTATNSHIIHSITYITSDET